MGTTDNTETENSRILIVDDDLSICNAYNIILNRNVDDVNSSQQQLIDLFQTNAGKRERNSEFELQFAHQGQEGFFFVKESLENDQPFAVAIIDVRMPPGWDGIKTACEVRKIDPNIEIVIISAYSDYTRTNIVNTIGSPDKLLFLHKPIDPDEFMQVAVSLTRRWNIDKSTKQRSNELNVLNKKLQDEIAQRKHLGASIEKSDNRYRSVTQSATDCVVIIDANGKVLSVSYMASHFVIKELTNKKLEEYLPNASIPRYQQALKQIFEHGEADTFKIVGPNESCWNVQIIALRDEDNKIQSAMIVLADITEKNELQKKAIHNIHLAVLGMRYSTIAHEINNPNNVILLQTSWLAKAWIDIRAMLSQIPTDDNCQIGGVMRHEAEATISEFLSRIAHNSKKIAHIVENIVCRFNPKNQKNISMVSIADIVRITEQSLAEEISKRTNSFTSKIQKNLPLLKSNQLELEQVFFNIVLNALQSLPNKNCGINIDITYDKIQQQMVIAIQDEGVGIPEKDMEKIFEPFYTTKLDHGGTGLGLPICRSIIKRYAGTFYLKLGKKNGSEAIIIFPHQTLHFKGTHR